MLLIHYYCCYFQSLLLVNTCWFPPHLIVLPDQYYKIFQAYRKKTCPVCSSMPKDPCICLICGLFLCFRESCCRQQHLYECVQVCGMIMKVLSKSGSLELQIMFYSFTASYKILYQWISLSDKSKKEVTAVNAVKVKIIWLVGFNAELVWPIRLFDFMLRKKLIFGLGH